MASFGLLAYHLALAEVFRGPNVADRLRLAAGLGHERDVDAHGFERGEAEMDGRGALCVVAAARDHLSRSDHATRSIEEAHFSAETRLVAFRVEHEHARASTLGVG